MKRNHIHQLWFCCASWLWFYSSALTSFGPQAGTIPSFSPPLRQPFAFSSGSVSTAESAEPRGDREEKPRISWNRHSEIRELLRLCVGGAAREVCVCVCVWQGEYERWTVCVGVCVWAVGSPARIRWCQLVSGSKVVTVAWMREGGGGH